MDTRNVPIASDDEEISAIIESPCILLESLSLSIKKDRIITTGIANSKGAIPRIDATANDAKDT